MKEIPTDGGGGPDAVDHPATFRYQDGFTHGTLRLGPNGPPSGRLFDLDIPTSGHTTNAAGERIGQSFPQSEEIGELAGTLRNGRAFVVADSEIEHWFPGHAIVRGSAALVGAAVEYGLRPFTALRIQITGLGQLIGTRPIANVVSPGLFDGSRPESVTVGLSEDADIEWTTDCVEAAVQWNLAVSGLGDWTYFELRHSPWITIRCDPALAWPEWLSEWIRPLADLVALGSSQPQSITMAELALASDTPGHESVARVYGNGVGQTPYSVRFEHSRPPLFTFAGLPYSLQELVSRWRALEGSTPGFAETYLSVVQSERHPPASELLLLCAAAEAIDTMSHGAGKTTREAHRQRRNAVLSAAKLALSADDHRFLKRHVASDDRYTLQQRLERLTADCPAELVDALSLTDFPERLPRLRNDLTHGRSADLDELRRGTRNLRAVLGCQMLKALGLPIENASKHFLWRS